MKKVFASLLIIFAGSLLPFWVQAATLLVPEDHSTVEDAVNAANYGDIIELASDSYFENDIVISGKRITIKSADNDPSTCTINCNANGRAFKLNSGADVTFSGLTISNGRFTIVEGGAATGGAAIIVESSSLALENCIFQNNYVLMASTNESYKAWGGAVYIYGSAKLFTCEDCIFTTNTAVRGYGGALYLANISSESWINGCSFVSNGGPANAANKGGALYCKSSNVEIDQCTFNNNYCSTNGGGIYLTASVVEMEGGEFNANQALDYGGAIFGISSQLTIQKSGVDRASFSDNHADLQGGAINLGGSKLDLQSCDFSRNFLDLDDPDSSGGAISTTISGLLNLSDCIFENNRAVSGGGLDFLAGGMVTVKDCQFKENGPDSNSPSTSSKGGGVKLKLRSDTDLSIDRCGFVGNTAYSGGGMFFESGYEISSTYNVDAEVSNSLFNANQAHSGGGLFVTEYSPAYLRNCTFVGNSANSLGGGIWFFRDGANNSSLELVNSILWDNQVDSGAAEDGPQIYVTNGDKAKVSYCDVKDGCESEIDPSYIISSDPDFIDSVNEDFRLQDNSPCQDAGTDQFGKYNPEDDRDLDGRSRPVDNYDMGAYEVLAPLMVASFFSTGDSAPGLLESYTLTCEVYSKNGTPLTFIFDFGDSSSVGVASVTDLGDSNFRAVSQPHSYDVTDTYGVSCSVSDVEEESDNSEIIQITTTNLLPTADAGDEQVVVSTTATLHGEGYDPDGDDNALSYSWSLVYKDFAGVPNSSKNKSAVDKDPEVTGLETGIYDVTLTVTDSSESDIDTTRLSVAGGSSIEDAYDEGYADGKIEGEIDGLAAANCDVCAGGPITIDSEGNKVVDGPVLITGTLIIK